jgi:pimeloyl-ACP methyl ester carboxylesterase
MKKFQDERKKIVNIKLGKFKHPTPIAIYEPVVNKEEADIFLFIQGHGGNIPFVDIMNHNFYDGKYLITYEKMAHGENKNVASHMPNQYVKELGYVIDEIKKMFPKKRIFLLGESWGAALGMIYYYKNPKKINGLFA